MVFNVTVIEVAVQIRLTKRQLVQLVLKILYQRRNSSLVKVHSNHAKIQRIEKLFGKVGKIFSLLQMQTVSGGYSD